MCVSFFPLSEHSVSTVQALCPFLDSEERESLIALCVAELLNWQDREQDCIDSEIQIISIRHMMSHIGRATPISLT